jgi:hypothetical protein
MNFDANAVLKAIDIGVARGICVLSDFGRAGIEAQVPVSKSAQADRPSPLMRPVSKTGSHGRALRSKVGPRRLAN